MAWRFEPGERLDAAFQRVAAEEIAKIRAGLTDPAKDRARAIHEARQGFKRLRALVRLARPSLGDAFGDENRRWRDAGRRLSGSRDHTVLLETFDKVAATCGDDLKKSAVNRLRARLSANGAEHAPDKADGAVGRVLKMLDEGEKASATLTWPRNAKALDKALVSSQTQLKQNWKAARRSGKAEDLHDWRKRVKDQSSQLRLFRAIAPEPLRLRRDEEKRTAELLGEEHDLWLLGGRLSAASMKAAGAAACDALLCRVRDRRKELRREALRRGKSFAAQPPKAFSRELVTAWRDASESMPAAVAAAPETKPPTSPPRRTRRPSPVPAGPA